MKIKTEATLNHEQLPLVAEGKCPVCGKPVKAWWFEGSSTEVCYDLKDHHLMCTHFKIMEIWDKAPFEKLVIQITWVTPWEYWIKEVQRIAETQTDMSDYELPEKTMRFFYHKKLTPEEVGYVIGSMGI